MSWSQRTTGEEVNAFSFTEMKQVGACPKCGGAKIPRSSNAVGYNVRVCMCPLDEFDVRRIVSEELEKIVKTLISLSDRDS